MIYLNKRTISCFIAAIVAAGLAVKVMTAIHQPIEGGSIVLLGDSIVAKMAPLQKSLVPPINNATLLGVSGQTSSQISARAKDARGYDRVIIQAGTNDLLGLGRSDEILPSYRGMLETLKSSKLVLVVGVPRVHEDAMVQWSDPGMLTNRNIEALNAELVALCATYANCRAATEAMKHDVTGYTTDGVHKSQKGYELWARLLAAELRVPPHAD